MTHPIYRIENLIHRYDDQPVLCVDHLDIQPASILGLVGPNGSGKSTLLQLMAFVRRPSEGRIIFDGVPSAPFDASVRFQVTLLTQEPYLMKRFVVDNIAYGLKVRRGKEDRAALINHALAEVGLDPHIFSLRRWNELSGGEAQRVALAARLVLRPRVLLLDEPTASVDAASSELIRTASIKARDEWGTTLIIASHDHQWLYDVCDDVIHLFKGKPVGAGRVNMIFGPWISLPNGGFAKTTGDGRYFPVSPPPAEDATAFLDPSAIRILSRDAPLDGTNVVTVDGTITCLTIDKKSGHLFADVRIGSLVLTVPVTESHLSVMTLHRGWPVTLAYKPEKIRWR